MALTEVREYMHPSDPTKQGRRIGELEYTLIVLTNKHQLKVVETPQEIMQLLTLTPA
jgi:hypothetical protein